MKYQSDNLAALKDELEKAFAAVPQDINLTREENNFSAEEHWGMFKQKESSFKPQ